MYAITGITGQIGGVIGRILLSAGQPIRAVLRDVAKGRAWADSGCEVALATIEDAASLTAAFRGAEGVFVLVPPNFDPQPGFPEARAIGTALRSALDGAGPSRVVYLSTIGAQASQPNLLTQHTIIEQALNDLPVPITFLRPAWFMENCRWDVVPAREQGTIPSFLQPLNKPVPMVATADIGRVAFTKVLGRSVQMQIVPRDSWEGLFKSQGVKNPLPRMQMLNGFNEGWIEFESGEASGLIWNLSARAGRSASPVLATKPNIPSQPPGKANTAIRKSEFVRLPHA